jgi:hypothetical protein
LQNVPSADTVKTSKSRPIHLTIGIGQYPHMPAQWLIARRIDTFIKVARNCSTSFPGFLKRYLRIDSVGVGLNYRFDASALHLH